MVKKSKSKIHISVRQTQIVPASAKIFRDHKIVSRSIKSTKTTISSKAFDQYDPSFVQVDIQQKR